ncbi:hypothetical protein EMIT0347P_80268 [Pseudomonas sp. IT-347P]
MSLLAMAVCQCEYICLIHRHREQAHFYKALCVVTTCEHSLNPCGSWLASNGVSAITTS